MTPRMVLSKIATTLRRFRRREDGTATIEFVLMLPAFMALFMASFESGLLMTRYVMVDRALDMTVRDLRLGAFVFPPTMSNAQKHDILKAAVCERTVLIPNCMDDLKLELTPISKTTWSPLPATTACVDRSADVQTDSQISLGGDGDIMLIRACTVFDPIFPGTGIGQQLPRDESGSGYLLIARSAFVNEPR